ncbi:hypothetical protein I2F17_11940 [Acinetobacter sp. B10A]|uniref:hypothetical protein n=1 Tax=Acinetobacter baretiae TaxID=2605383 RepID=UPI001B3C8322|nr:hypothetical protein [Acinetobacter baretiae]MBF7686528.1 hypothetical protein [Acinetobacter baretiae]
MSNICIEKSDFYKLSIATQNEIISLFKNKATFSEGEYDDQGELTKKQVYEIISGLSEKSRNVLKAIASFHKNNILFDNLLNVLGTNEKEIKGVWSGLTTRSRNITNDPEFLLITWLWNEDICTMKFHPITYKYIVMYFK